MYAFSFEKFGEAFGPILSCLNETLLLTFSTFFFSIVLATILAFLSNSKNPIISSLLKIWLSFFRGTPILVQLFFFVYGLFPFLPIICDFTPRAHAILCLSLAYSSYMSETIRGAIRSVDKGQLEGCYAIGMTYWQAMYRVILPQALHYVIPPLSNNFLEVFKGTSLVSMVGITEMMLKAKMMSSKDLRFMETYLAILVIYWVINIFFTICQKHLESRISSKY